MRRMTAPREWRCLAAALGPGQTQAFTLGCRGRDVKGFVVNHDGDYHAYVNRCPHAGTPLDLWPNEFYSEDGRRRVGGPCAGDALERLPLRRDGDTLVVGCP
jgi:hypothetical protein